MNVVGLPQRATTLERMTWALAEVGSRRAVITVPAPVAPLSSFLSAVARERSFLWNPPDGPAAAGSGAAASITLSGPHRLEQLGRWMKDLFGSLIHCRGEGERFLPPRVFGGLAFEPGASQRTPWQSFGDGYFALPRWMYARHDGGASLTVAVHTDGAEDGRQRAEVLAELDAILEALHSDEGTTTRTRIPAYRRIVTSCVTEAPLEQWQTLIDEIKRAIASGKFTKLVAARRCDVDLLEPLDDLDVLTRLIAEPSCTRFAFRRTDASFVGATPETLFRKRGREVMTEALAGTIRSLGTAAPILSVQTGKLLGSDKDALEHAYVVRDIDATIGPLSVQVTRPEFPEIRKVRNILHLCTPFVAQLKDTTTAFDLLAAMHPTPAVGGLPREGAAAWIAEHEAHERGWYTGPVGWLDASGDGTFVVAIRSGVITKDKAYVYTGAGVVADSDAELEYAETQLKQLPLLRALGVDAM